MKTLSPTDAAVIAKTMKAIESDPAFQRSERKLKAKIAELQESILERANDLHLARGPGEQISRDLDAEESK